MAFKDFFKKRKKPDKKEEKKDIVKKPLKTKEAAVKVAKKQSKKIDEGFAYRILKAPHISEKATDLVQDNRYVFKVYERANKTEIKKAVEKLYNVDVISVKIIKVPPKKRRFKGIIGLRKGYKKTIVEVKKGQKIEILSR